MNKRKIRDSLRLIWSILFFWIYIPHLLIYGMGGGKCFINSDLSRQQRIIKIKINKVLTLLYCLHNNSYFRSLFYYRIGPVQALLISWYRPGCHYFTIPYSTKIGKGFMFFHPFSTILNAERIGDNFSCGHNTTLGATKKGRPSIGNNVALGVGCIIIGNVRIGDNAIVGAGAVIVKDVPENAVVGGNPAKILKYRE